MRIWGKSVLGHFSKIICNSCRNEKECFIMEKSASDLSQQSAQEEVIAKQASESVPDQKAKLCHEGEGKDKHCESISSSKDKAKHDSSSSYSREKEKSSDKLESSASSKEGDKHKSSSSNKHEDKEREKSKERSSSKHKEGSSGGSGERKKEVKPKGIDRPKDTRDVDKDKEKSSDKQQPKQVVDSKPKIKEEPKSPVKEEYSPVKDNFILSGVKKEIKQNPESDDDLPLKQRFGVEYYDPHTSNISEKESHISEENQSANVAQQVNQDKPEKALKRPAKDDADDDMPLVDSCEEEKHGDGVKWTFLEHKGPVFAPPYEPLPDDVSFYYDGKKMKLSPPAEEVATFYAKMLKKDYTACDVFNKNFFEDWSKTMTPEEKSTITDLRKCNFEEMYKYSKAKKDRKNMSEKKAKKEAIQKEYGICMMDGHEKKIENFKIEPPGLFRGRGDHPKQGMLKMRINPEDVIINCSSDSRIPEPPAGHRWKKVLHDNKVTWLAKWTENVQGHTKYVKLNAASKLKGEKDWQKYVIARNLHRSVDHIRAKYREDWKSKEMKIRQRGVAMYFIDKLALSIDNEKEEGETADTVGCCSLRVEHVKLHDELDGKENVVEFDILGKDSIRYYNTVSVDKQVYKNLKLFMDNKQPGDDLFDRLNSSTLIQYLNSLMKGLTAEVFHTFNASKTLQEQLNLLTISDDPVPAKLQSYHRAVAILCNHQRSVPKNISEQMDTLQIKDENKEIALGTFKLNNLDPRISVAWCKKRNVPLEEIYNETHLTKFSWAIDLTEPDFKY